MRSHSIDTAPNHSSLTRRHFLKSLVATSALTATTPLSLSLAPTAIAASPAKSVAPVVGSQLYGWGQYYERDGKSLDTHLDEILSALRDAGYHYAEGSLETAHPENNQAFADRLKKKGMRPVSLYTGGSFHDPSKSEATVERILSAAKVCHNAGFSVLVCNPDPIGREKTDAELKTQAKALAQLGQGLKPLHMRLGLHHHTPEMRNQAREFHSNFKATPAGTVDFCIDTHWVFRGGMPPLDALNTYGDRVVSWHLRQSRNQIWWEDLNEGDIDYSEIHRAAQRIGCAPRYTVELALEKETRITRSAAENHKRSRDYVMKIFGV